MRFDAIRRIWERLRASGGNAAVLDTDSFTESERAVGRLILPLIEDLEQARKVITDLSARTEALASALDKFPVPAIVLDAKERFVSSNRQARDLLVGKALPPPLFDAARRLLHAAEGESARVQLAHARHARLVVAEVDANPEPDAAHVIFIVPEEQPATTISPTLLITRLQLTPMQARVVSLVSCGLSNREIASRLGLSTETVRKHLATAYARTGVNNRAGIVALAYDARFGGTSATLH